MENRAISISLFRVSGDSRYLDMIFSCPREYYFSSLQLQVRVIQDNEFVSKFFDLSPALFDNTPLSPTCTVNKKHWTVRLPLEKLGIQVPAIYIATLKADRVFDEIIHKNDLTYSLPAPYGDPDTYEIIDSTAQVYYIDPETGETGEPVVEPDGNFVYGFVYTDPCAQLSNELDPDTMICSDVNYAYRCMIDDLFMNEITKDSCEDVISDEVIRKYLILYGHQAALATEDLETAEMYFKLIGSCFNRPGCGSDGRTPGSCCGCGNGSGSNCGHHNPPVRPPHNSCNCGR